MKKKLKGKEIAVLSFLLAVVLILGAVALWVMKRYQAQGMALITEFDGVYTYDGIHLMKEDGSTMKMFYSNPPEYFPSFEKKTIDLSPFGWEGESLCYYDVNGAFICPDARYEGFWTVSRTDRFVFVKENGEKYGVKPQDNLVYPLFTGSVEGVDPKGQDVVAFSANGTYALGLMEDAFVIYHTDPMDDSFHVVEFWTVDLSSYENPVFGGFVSDTQCYFTATKEGKTQFFALNCPDGKIASADLSDLRWEGIRDRIYAQVTEFEKEEKETYPLSWVNLLLGKVYRGDLGREADKATLCAVSPQGNLALFEVKTGETTEFVILSEERSFSVQTVLGEGERAEGGFFCYDNVVVLTVNCDGERVSRAYTVLFS